MILSAKSIKTFTKDELGYDLSLNAFELLNRKVTDLLKGGQGTESINEWLMKVLRKAGELCDNERRVVRRSDMEVIIDYLTIETKPDVSEIEIETDVSECDKANVLETDVPETELETDAPELEDETSFECYRNTESTDDSACIENVQFSPCPSGSWRTVDIVQTTPRELEEEIERLKRIIQIILNKQAELA